MAAYSDLTFEVEEEVKREGEKKFQYPEALIVCISYLDYIPTFLKAFSLYFCCLLIGEVKCKICIGFH